MNKILLTMAMAAATLLPTAASAARVVVVSRPFYGGGFYRPNAAFYGPGWGYWGTPAYRVQNTGDVKLETKVKDGEVFVNGAFAGNTHDNHTMHLRPGTYNIEVRHFGRTQFEQRVYVTAGKTLKLYPEL